METFFLFTSDMCSQALFTSRLCFSSGDIHDIIVHKARKNDFKTVTDWKDSSLYMEPVKCILVMLKFFFPIFKRDLHISRRILCILNSRLRPPPQYVGSIRVHMGGIFLRQRAQALWGKWVGHVWYSSSENTSWCFIGLLECKKLQLMTVCKFIWCFCRPFSCCVIFLDQFHLSFEPFLLVITILQIHMQFCGFSAHSGICVRIFVLYLPSYFIGRPRLPGGFVPCSFQTRAFSQSTVASHWSFPPIRAGTRLISLVLYLL